MKNHTVTRSQPTVKPPPGSKPMGLGDAVAMIAQPIAKAIDAATSVLPDGMKTLIVQCGGCKARQEALNAAVPHVFSVKLPVVDTKK